LRFAPAFLGLLALFAAACDQRREAVPAGPERDTVRVNVVPNLTFAPFMIAKEEGYFDAERIDIQFISMDLNSALLGAASGDLDVTASSMTAGVFNMTGRNAPVRIVAEKGHAAPDRCASEGFAAPPATAARIARNGFRGETFVIRRAGVTEYLIDRLLQKEGLSREEIRFSDLPSEEYLSAMQNEMDVVIYTLEPRLSQMTASGLVRVVASANEIAPGHYFSVVLFGKRLLTDDRELGRRFMKAYLRGVRRYNEGKTPRNVEILSKYTKLDPEIIRSACWISIADDARIPSAALDNYLAWAVSAGYLDERSARAEWWDGEFIELAKADFVSGAQAPP
jgi:NitT/TauT family transport system substrate-binding protein